MAARRLVFLLFFALALGLAVLRPARTHSAPAQDSPPVPEAALNALREGRYLRASQILREYLGATRDSSAAAILLSARAEAGWGDWQQVEQLLRGRRWLDTISSGQGWELLARSQYELGRYEESSTSLARFLAVAEDAGDRAQGLAEVRRAIAHRQADENDSARAAFHRAAPLLPQIADWIHVFAATAAAYAGDTAAVEQDLGNADSALVADWGWRSRLRARQVARLPRAALELAERVAASHSSSATRAEAWLRAAELRLELNDSVGARAALLRTLSIGPATDHALAAARLLAPLRQAGAADHRVIGELYLRHGNVERGVAGLERWLDAGAASAAERVQSHYQIGRALFNAGRYADAERRLRAFTAQSRDAGAVASALYLAARAQYRDGRRSEALGTLQHIVDEYQGQPASAQAAYLIGDLAHDQLEVVRAARMYRRTIALAPAAEAAGHAHMRLGGIAFERRAWREAAREFDAYLARHPDGRRAQQAHYWAALSKLELGDTAAARGHLCRVRAIAPFSYYSDRAVALLEEDFWSVPLEASPPARSSHDARVERALGRLDLLREIGWDEAAGYELARTRRFFGPYDGAIYTLAEGLNERGFTSTGIGMAWDIYRREGAWNLRLLRIVYPFPYREIITAEAAERDVDPFLAAGLIRQESMFNPRAVSGAGAVGLMQVMPATARALAPGVGIRKVDTDLLRRPDVNVLFGMRYLADQLRSWNGRLVPVLAAYNAGPSRVERWRQFPEWGRDQLFTERIPFDETRDYVKIVQHNASMYRALYGGASAAATAGE